jgi:hypothetical protein
MPTEIDADIIRRIKQIHTLTDKEQGVTDEEAANAASILSRLLSSHGLDIADLDALEDASGIVHEELVDSLDNWRQALLYHLSVNNFCKVMIFDSGDESKIVLVGEPANIVVVKSLYAWLVAEFPRITTEAMDAIMDWSDMGNWSEPESFMEYIRHHREMNIKQESQDMAYFDPDKWQSSYLYGLVMGIGTQLAEKRRKPTDKEESFTSSALARIETDEKEEQVNDYVDQHFETETKEVKEDVHAATFVEGFERGKTFPLDPQVYGPAAGLQLPE